MSQSKYLNRTLDSSDKQSFFSYMLQGFLRLFSKPVFYTMVVLFTAHWLILLNDGVYYDGILVQSWREMYSFSFLDRWFWDVGKPLLTAIYWPVLYFSNWIFISKLVNFISLFFTAILVRKILESSKLFSERDALFLSLLALAYSGVQMAGEMAALQYFFLFPVYLFGIYIYLQSTNYKEKATAFLLMYLGFFTSSLLLLHYFFFLLLAISRQKNSATHIFKTPLRMWGLFSLPLFFWISRSLFFPPLGIYKSYYSMDLSLPSIKKGLAALFKFPIWAEIKNAFFVTDSIFLSLIFVTVLLLTFLKIDRVSPQKIGRSKAAKIMCAGFLALVLGALPYVLVRQYFEQFGWSTKNNVLMGFGLSLALFGFVCLFAEKYRYAIVSTLIVLFSINANKNYVDLQLGSIKTNAFISFARKDTQVEHGSFFQLKDEFNIPRLPVVFSSHNFSYIFYQAKKNLVRNGIILETQEIPKFLTPAQTKQIVTGHAPILATPEVNVDGSQYFISLKRKDQHSESNLVFRYYVLKFFDPNKLEEYYSDVVDISITKVLPATLSGFENSSGNSTNN